MMARSRRIVLPAAAALSAALALVLAPNATYAQGTPKILLIGIDGVRPDVLAQVATPVMDSLAASGWYTAGTRTTTPSVSGPSWSSMLTGVWPAKHGVTDNGFEGRRYGQYPDFLTLLERVRPELATFAAIDWLPLASLEGGGPALSSAIDMLVAVDGYELGWAEADSVVAARAAQHLASASGDAAFVYLGNPDETSHRHGSIGVEYRAAISLSDRHVGWLMEALRTRPAYEEEDWLVLISTDHGRREDGGHGGDSPEEMTTFILASGGATGSWPVAGPTFIVDIAATALHHLGAPSEIAAELDGRPLGTARSDPLLSTRRLPPQGGGVRRGPDSRRPKLMRPSRGDDGTQSYAATVSTTPASMSKRAM
ncbi:alkaline phosphatase family protein [Candidatus Palauibacter sp.]|uniref:alkaline phosphatase family protein n=1 Tax=Candidatus Palauibacter sp. TaxID=3101350 RepID=UPI003AF20795